MALLGWLAAISPLSAYTILLALSLPKQTTTRLQKSLSMSKEHGDSSVLHTMNTAVTNTTAALSLNLLTWNILAPGYASPTKFPGSDPDVLDWHQRKQAIADWIAKSRADIVCLQEVPVVAHQLPWWGSSKQQQYDDDHDDHDDDKDGRIQVVVQNVTVGHPVACVVAIRKNRGLRVVHVESRSRALIVVLEWEHPRVEPNEEDEEKARSQPLQPPFMPTWPWMRRMQAAKPPIPKPKSKTPSTRIVVASVHLEAGRDHAETRHYQMRSLLKRMHRYLVEPPNPGTDVVAPAATDTMLVMAGDFNMHEDSELYQSLMANATDNEDVATIGPTSTTTKRLPLFGPFVDLHATGNRKNASVKRTYAGGRKLDYIWTQTVIASPTTTATATPSLPTQDIVYQAAPSWWWTGHPHRVPRAYQETGPQCWPAVGVPSDHLPLGATLRVVLPPPKVEASP